MNSKFIDNKVITLRESNRNEDWLHQWIVDKPERLGLGPFEIKAQEVHHYKNKGGRLDILGYSKSTDTYYEIEVMLGECDSDHGFRCLDYWARERINKPNQKHYAVLIAENLQGRYKTLIETLPQFLPFIAIEIRTLKLEGVGDEEYITCYAETIAQPDELTEVGGIATIVEGKAVLPRDEEWWRENKGNNFVDAVQEMAEYCEKNIGPSRIDYSANSYISLKKGKRAWLPMWPRLDGFYVYLPDDGSGTVDEPSERFRTIQQKLATIGIDASWVYKYNAGSNPIGFALPKSKTKNGVILDILKESYSLA
jgi:hypothetical protein